MAKLSIIRPEYNEIREEIFSRAPFIYKFVEHYNEEEKYVIRVIHRAEFIGNGHNKEEALNNAVKLAIKDLEDDIEKKRFVGPDQEEYAIGEGGSEEERLLRILDSLNFSLGGNYEKTPYLYTGNVCTLISLVDYGKEFIGDSLDEVYKQIRDDLEGIRKEAYRKREAGAEVISNDMNN